MFELRDYQRQCVNAVVQYFKRMTEPALAVLPTGAGKSLVIAELARLAKGRVLVLAHVKELVEQNCAKYQHYGYSADIYAAGLGSKNNQQQVVFASIQSVHRNLADFSAAFSLLVIDECHRVSSQKTSSYQQVISHLQHQNPNLKILGLTATPYRLGQGYIYQFHYGGVVRGTSDCFFRWCLYELSLRYLLKQGYLTPPKVLHSTQLSYDFSELTPTRNGQFSEIELNQVIDSAKRVTPQIIKQVQQYAHNKLGVMIFAATVQHAYEIMSYLPSEQSALITGDCPTQQRDEIIAAFKAQHIKYLVNVSVLTTGFDAPHVDLIAILRPTASVSLYQQIVGRGLRLSPNKTECLILDYAANLFDLYRPEIEPPPQSNAERVIIPCPLCHFENEFWGKTNGDGLVLEHYGRQCQGMRLGSDQQPEPCGFRFRAKYCVACGAEHDIAAKQCKECGEVLVDPDKKLREALALKIL